ncbi:SAF domain-containing protein [Nocardioides plantarum]|uniref:SAF domain-containing protein n=1 Tax=Nocardioides plantarum TaxID=29299 RepID=A0ABV5K7K2_9ACTN|nr:SAF domain-containing protein [Nocardioides plantarum]
MPLDLSRPAALLGVVRRQVLRRRRLLAAVLTAVAVASGLAATTRGPTASVPVVVAAHDLPAGEVLDADDLTTVAFAPASVPEGRVDRPAEVSGRVLAAPLTRGAPLTEVALVGPAMTGNRSDLRAVPVRLPDAGAVALLRVGDQIDVVATDPQTGHTATVAEAAVVLALPAADPATGPTGLSGRLVVLGVGDAEDEPLAGAGAREVLTFSWSRR